MSRKLLISRNKQKSINIAATVFLLPAVLVMIIFIGYPIVENFNLSFVSWNGMTADKTPVGLANWQKILSDRQFWFAFKNNIIIVFLSLLFQVPFALALATFLDMGEKKVTIFKVFWFLPYLMSSVAIGILFKYVLEANYGIFATISKMFGGKSVDLLGNPDRALFAVIGVICWQFIPFYMVYYLAAYGNLPVELYEAAIIDGATRWKYFLHVALPGLKPTIISGAILSIIGSLKYFDLIFVMTGGGPGNATELMATYMYRTAFIKYDMGYGSTVAGAMFILITVIALLTIKSLTRLGSDD